MNSDLTNILKKGGVALLPTDTIYGLHALVKNTKAVERIYRLKSRNERKPLIVLISSLDDLKKFDVKLTPKIQEFLKNLWPNPISVILPVTNPKWDYLHRGSQTLAFRMPKNEFLLNVIKETGPIVSTSANPEGEKNAETIKEAKNYFQDNVDFYLDKGPLHSQPSTVLKIEDNKIEILREGNPEIVALIKKENNLLL